MKNFVSIGDHISDGILITDSQGVISYLNAAATKLLRLEKSAIGQPLISQLPEFFGMLNVLATGQEIIDNLIEIKGNKFYTKYLLLNENSHAVGAVALFRERTELEALRSRLCHLEELNQEFEAIMDFSYDGIGVIDTRGRLTRLNASYEKITGIKKEELLNLPLDAFVQNGVFSAAPSLIALKERRQVTMTQKINNGTKVLITSNPIFNLAGEVIRVIANIRDLSELEKLEEENQVHRSLSQQYHTELELLKAQQLLPDDVVARSSSMVRVVETSVRVAQSDTFVLIEGESGVGKEVIARLIHRASSRSANPFIKINCAAIPVNLLESELFGYSPGAFTGAQKNGKLGLLELANNGTILMDEIGEMPLDLQAKLLRVLEEQVIYRVGGIKPVNLNIRVLAATNRDLQEMVSQKLFRQDLYYRLRVLPISVPPLRQRREDIPPLVNLFLQKINAKLHTRCRLSTKAMTLLETYSWPGNVRQLQNVLEGLVVSTCAEIIEDSAVILMLGGQNPNNETIKPCVMNQGLTLPEAQNLLEKDLLEEALHSCNSARQVAKLLGISHPTVLKRIKKYGLRLNQMD